MDLKEMTIGIFTVKQLGELRWQVVNSLTSFRHVTYGTEAEVTEQLEVQSKAWKDKMAFGAANKGKRGAAWRQKQRAEYHAAHQIKKTVTA